MKRNKLFPILGLVAGALAIIFAFVAFASGNIGEDGTGIFTSYSFYGGDAYTGIQNAGADTSRNVRTLSGITISGFRHLSTALGGLLLALGLGLVGLSGNRLLEGIARTRYEAAVLEALNRKAEPVPPVAPSPIIETQKPAEAPAAPIIETPVVEAPAAPIIETPVVETPAAPVVETPVVEAPAAESAAPEAEKKDA